MTVKGGNTDIYQGDGRLKMAESLQRQHPDVTTITQKWGRWQHHVDYSSFRKNRPLLRQGAVIPTGAAEYGMELRIYENPEAAAGAAAEYEAALEEAELEQQEGAQLDAREAAALELIIPQGEREEEPDLDLIGPGAEDDLTLFDDIGEDGR